MRVSVDACELTKRFVNVLRTNTNPLLCNRRQRLGIQWNSKLFFIGRADDTVSFDSGAEEHDGTNRPVILAVAFVVVWRAAHFALRDDD